MDLDRSFSQYVRTMHYATENIVIVPYGTRQKRWQFTELGGGSSTRPISKFAAQEHLTNIENAQTATSLISYIVSIVSNHQQQMQPLALQIPRGD
ncbi:hypothetical protein TMatcc_004254 [Talaromyces marneffei ATCC 18224]